ncbi:ciliated left-right organizer metallopeptidase [Hoplias malabaricus]|uniref:ciliated left-right organizer metallopeptidase n=1 Tax=Hoplias malabaricus TaxID=27720 RepID=UPI0034627A76
MKAVHVPVLLLLLLLRPVYILGKCIFDEVQSSVSVVSSPIAQTSSSDWAFNANGAKSQVIAAEGHRRTPLQTTRTPLHAKSLHPHPHRPKRMDKEMIKDIVEPQPMRIKTWIPRESPIISQWERERVEAALSGAISTVSNLLSVIRVPDRLLLNRDINKYCRFIWRNRSSANYNRCGRANEKYRSEHCLGLTIPDDHLRGYDVYPHPDQAALRTLKPAGPGVPDTDFILYVSTQSTEKCRADSSVLAYSAHCETDTEGRPVAGAMVICREPLSVKEFSHEGMVQTVIHELFHILGFSRELFSTWRDCSLSCQMGVGCCSHGHVTNTDETGQMRLYSPSVRKALHTHLNSTHAELGAPLENQDAGSGGLSSHWEARVLQGSIMTAVLGEPSLVRIDLVTLSALRDTGWYSVNFSQAQSLLWGEGEGVLFGSLSTCNQPSSFFCTGSGLGCHYLHLHKGECQSDKYLEGCRIYKPLANGSECWKEENEGGGSEDEWSEEIYHTDSRCFLSTLIRQDQSSISVSVAGRCYRHRCTGRNRYQIQLKGSDWLHCPAGGSIEVTGYRGAVYCPDKRLCYYHEAISLISPHHPFNSAQLFTASPAIQRDHSLSKQPMPPLSSPNSDPGLHLSMSRYRTLMTVTVLGVTAVLSTPILIIVYRKCCSDTVRVHALRDPPAVVHLQAA